VATDGSTIKSTHPASHSKQNVENISLGFPELIRWHSVDGLELEGTLLYPPEYGPKRKPEKSLPLIVDIHGGPLSNPSFGLQELDALHCFAAHGYLCLSVDYRRSGNYGWKHIEDAIDDGNYVGLDADDIMSAVRHLIAQGLADSDRIGARGWSHGGYLANWLATQFSIFKAVVSGEGKTYFPNNWDSIRDVYMGGTPEDVPERYYRYAPLTYASNTKAAILLVYGERSNLAQQRHGEAFRDAVNRAGGRAELLLFAGEGHGLSQKENRERYWRRTLEWFDTYLK
jgi:dipeptidyl aminopeptidase/acylaminoacyl peptidase